MVELVKRSSEFETSSLATVQVVVLECHAAPTVMRVEENRAKFFCRASIFICMDEFVRVVRIVILMTFVMIILEILFVFKTFLLKLVIEHDILESLKVCCLPYVFSFMF
jgi:hypothetical protein